MKKIIACLLLSTSILGPSALAAQDEVAAEGKVNVVAERIPYQRQMPLAVRKKAPRKIDSLFFGMAKLESANMTLACHIYQPRANNKQKARQADEDFADLHACTLDLFVVRKRGRQQIFERINSIAFRSASKLDAGSITFRALGISWLWLDPAQRKIPLLMIHAYSSEGEGSWGTEALVIFNQGLSAKPVLQPFSYGSTPGLSGYSWYYAFDKTDKKGFLMVQRTDTEARTVVKTSFNWDGTQFVETESVTTHQEG